MILRVGIFCILLSAALCALKLTACQEATWTFCLAPVWLPAMGCLLFFGAVCAVFSVALVTGRDEE